MKSIYSKPIGFIAALCVVAALASCASSKKAAGGGSMAGGAPLSMESHIDKVVENRSDAKAMVAKVKARLAMSGSDISTSGTMRMKRGEVIQISLVDPILGITEVARIEFSKEKVLIIDRLNRRYLEEPYSKVSFLQEANISFATLEALFWNEVFQPGRKELDADGFACFEEADVVGLGFKDKYLAYAFATDRSTGRLEGTSIKLVNGADYSMEFIYDDFRSFAGKEFPYSETLQFKGSGKSIGLTLKMSSISADSDWSAHTTVSGKYKKLGADEILKSLIGQ